MKQEKNANAIEQLEDLLNKGILTVEEYETKKQQLAAIENEKHQQDESDQSDKGKPPASSLSEKFYPIKDLAMKHKKITCVVLAVILLIVGFLPGYSIGRKRPSQVQLVFGSNNDKSEVKGKGSQKNPYHLNENIVFETFNSACGKNITYTVNISRVLRSSALTNYMNGKNLFSAAGIIGSIQASWEGDDVGTVAITPRIGMVFQNDDGNYCQDDDSIYNRDGAETTKLINGKTYNNVIMLIPNYPDKEYDHIQIDFNSKDAKGQMVTNKLYVAFSLNDVES